MRSTTAIIAALLLTAALWSGDSAADDCGLSISAPNVSVTWNQNFSFQAVTFSVTKSKNAECAIAVTFTKGGGTDYNSRRMNSGGTTLSYQLYGDSSLSHVLKDVPDITGPSNYLQTTIPQGKDITVTLTYYVSIPPGLATQPTLKPPGTYIDNYSLKVYSGEAPSSFHSPESTTTVILSTIIPRIIEISLVNTGGAFNPNQTSQVLNFGTLQQGQAQAFDLLVRSNAGYAISFSSQHNGALRHASSSVLTPVSYGLTVNSSPRSLAGSSGSPVIVATGSGQTSMGGSASPIAVSIGDTSQSIAGPYSDNITVTATTTE
jgi:spore coat protein U-like protein